ncbi:MAG TPA: hypothetical protein VFV38_12275 [Ktedonobacteraceae bacterium]|nr:hypothetical protein [Ktedonobacteraceae bacterium]
MFLKQKWYSSLAILVTLLCMMAFMSNTSIAHAASLSKRSFTVGGGTISGLLTPLENPGHLKTSSTQSSTFPSDLLNASGVQYFVITGELVGTHYAYPLEFTANKGQSLGIVEISSDPIAHTQVIAVGMPTAKLLNPSMQQGKSQSQSQQKTASIVPFTSSGSKSFTTTWYDPVNLNVNWVKDTINFSYNGSIVTSFSGSDSRWWLSESGWFEAGHSIDSGYIGAGSNPQIQAAVYTFDHMQNNTFCAGQTTNVYYSNNAVIANGNGSTSGTINTWDDGGCSSWLHYGTALG